jgi:phosphoribosylglycinamide formyltransferase 1
MLDVGVLISGRGSNLQALIDACAAADFPARIALVISNTADAYGLARATAAGIATCVISHRDYDSREDFDAAMTAALQAAGVQLVCLAGFMRILSASFVQQWEDKLINIHPSLLPSFKGLHTHARALEAGCKLHGCTVHFVEPALDEGPILLQAAVTVQDDDTPDTLAARVLEQEHKLYPQAVRLIAEGRTRIEGMRVHIV